MIARSKRYKDSIDEELAGGGQELSSAVSKLAGFNKVKFDETVEASKANPQPSAVRGTVNLPQQW